ncbi:MAG: DoxX family membrane protein [Propionibacteriaceae bacterium]|jgi:uncharacterized membrane protein YphA (DoxX/SURF4 family)|nr:DoxX family membrane protein [Propionibacteriaceae bacterium]
MSLLRLLARGLLASYFVADGVKAVTQPQTLAEDVAPLAEAVHAGAQRVLPPDIAKRVPADPEGYVRLHGAVQTVGALMMATGLGRRLGATLVALAYLPRVVMARPASPRADKTVFVRELALLGGLLIESRDTQGKPGMAWLLTHSARPMVPASDGPHHHCHHGVKAAKKQAKTVSETLPLQTPTSGHVRRQAAALGHALTPAG